MQATRFMHDFSESGEVNARFLSRICACRKIAVLSDGRLMLHLTAENVTAAWFTTLSVTLIQSFDGRFIRYACVATAREEDDGWVILTYPCEISDGREDPFGELLDPMDAHGFLISHNGTWPLRVHHA